VTKKRQSEEIPRNQLITMIAQLRGVLVEFDRVYGLPQDCEREVGLVLQQTSFDASESDLVDGKFAELGVPRISISDLAVALHRKWQSQATWTMPQAFDDLSLGEQARWLELARWVRKGEHER